MELPIRIIPVLDVLNGIAVRAVAGNRAEYRPLVSRWCESADPIAVAEAIRRQFGFESFYFADLDAILGRPPNWPLYAELHSLGFQLWVDAGIHNGDDAFRLAECGVATVVEGLETIANATELACIVRDLGSERIAFSLDLKDGRPLGSWGDSAMTIADQVIEAGVKTLIVLDLSRVGMGQGIGTEQLLTDLSMRYPNVELIAGGGVHGPKDLERLRDCGVAVALVASALHDGRLE